MPNKKSKNGRLKGSRNKTVKVKTAKGRKASSTRWLKRQLNDPYVQEAQKEGYRSRAAYKLLEIDAHIRFLKPHTCVLDIGAAPGSWLQVIERKLKNTGCIIGVDLQAIEPLRYAHLLLGDFTEEEVQKQLQQRMQQHDYAKCHVILSDMAAPSCGHTQTDHMRIVALCEEVIHFALSHLETGGTLVCKVLRGGTETQLLEQVKKHFTQVKHIKPAASRSDSAEMYLVATGFKKIGALPA